MTAEDWETKYWEAWECFKVERIETLRLKDRMSHKQKWYIASATQRLPWQWGPMPLRSAAPRQYGEVAQ